MYAPLFAFAVNVGAVATPLAFVTAVFNPPANVPLAPVCAGAANVTVAPLTGFPPLSFTVACRAVANAELIAALWGVPAVAVMEAAGPAMFVKLKFAGPTAPAVAVTT
jgi:hypothetical protein